MTDTDAASQLRLALCRSGVMSARTPGPWVLQGFRIYGPPDEKHGNGRALIGGVVDDGIESMANARLMVAAPELLDALTAILAALKEVPVAFGVHVHDAIDAAKEALAKACSTSKDGGNHDG